MTEDHSRVRSRWKEMAAKPSTSMMVPQFVFNVASRWPVGSAVSVCFYGGDTALRRDVMAIAGDWTTAANLTFDTGAAPEPRSCDSAQPSSIRIGFDEAGYWSVVGKTPTPERLTMNLQGFDAERPEAAEFRQIVLHEFGHAMGFEHEHQHPAGGCDNEFDWPMVYEAFAAPPNRGWDREKVDFNFRALPASSAYISSMVDRGSIMHYMLEPWMFKNGLRSPCCIQPTMTLSALDKDGAASGAYPRQNSRPTAGGGGSTLARRHRQVAAGDREGSQGVPGRRRAQHPRGGGEIRPEIVTRRRSERDLQPGVDDAAPERRPGVDRPATVDVRRRARDRIPVRLPDIRQILRVDEQAPAADRQFAQQVDHGDRTRSSDR